MNKVRLPLHPAAQGALLADGSRPKIIPADVSGRFQSMRTALGYVLILFAAVLPWIKVGGSPAFFLDVENRHFFLLGHPFNAQDGPLLFLLVTGVGFSLIVMTTLLGRVWCGYACPHSVVLDRLFRPIERLIEGSRDARFRRDAGPWTANRAARFAAKHAAFLFLSFALAHGVLSYFVTVPGVFALVRGSPATHLTAFVWTMAMTAVIYANFGYFREQLCLGVCPYGRLQGVLVDDDTLSIGYDAARGEPRVKAGHDGGACVDCNRCVVVCPTGIDIRNGAQLDCIGCAACVDACDDIMAKLGRPKGLVRYESLRGFSGAGRRILRPRVAVYGVLGLVGFIVLMVAVLSRHAEAELNVTRLPGAPYQLQGDTVRNSFDAHLMSKRAEAAVFDLSVEAPPGADVVLAVPRAEVPALGSLHAPIFVTTPRDLPPNQRTVHVHARREGGGETLSADVVLVVPSS
jgi:cytochrome c oxidase accessory protein FixG